MMYQEFLTLTNRKISFKKYTEKIEPAYMNSPLNKQDFCTQYIQQTKRTKTNNNNEFNKDKMIKAKTFKTALKHLSKMVQGDNDGKVFYISDIMDQIEEGIKKWNNIIKEDKNRVFTWIKTPRHELEKLATDESGDMLKKDYYRMLITDSIYYNFWITPDNTYFRLQIELQEEGIAYIDCGYKNI